MQNNFNPAFVNIQEDCEQQQVVDANGQKKMIYVKKNQSEAARLRDSHNSKSAGRGFRYRSGATNNILSDDSSVQK